MPVPLGGKTGRTPHFFAAGDAYSVGQPSPAQHYYAASENYVHTPYASTSAAYAAPPGAGPDPMSQSDSLLLALRRSRPNTRVFRALFQYIPLRDSPNENPHLELPLQAGEYVLVSGQMDEDQFYYGENLMGRTGLVPSNYVERVPDHIILQNASRTPSPSYGTLGRPRSVNFLPDHSPTISRSGKELPPLPQRSNSVAAVSVAASPQNPRASSPSFTLAVPPHHAQITHDFTDAGASSSSAADHYDHCPPLPDSVCPYPPADISKVTVQELRHPDQPRVPFPRELTVEKKLSRSVVISWSPPDDQMTAVTQYHVCVDGAVKAVVPGTYKCKALIEDLNLDHAVNVSVRAVTENGNSPDAACTIAIGAEAPVAPQHVRVLNITPVSACVSWYPSNSNAEHVLLLNALKVGVCPPGVFQVQLQGLQPSTIYRVSMRTKHPKAVLEQRPVERCVDFKTLPKIGLPDPPMNVQVEVGPQPGTLLVSWKPVSNQPRPPSRAAIHSYLIYADGRNIAQVPAATADHVLLRLADFADDPPIFITVRTRTREGAISADSNVVRVPRTGSALDTSTAAQFFAASTAGMNYQPQTATFPTDSSRIMVNTTLPTNVNSTGSLPNSFVGGAAQNFYQSMQHPSAQISAGPQYVGAGQGLLTTAVPRVPQNMNAAAIYTAMPDTGMFPGAQPAAMTYSAAFPPVYDGTATFVDMNQSGPPAVYPYQNQLATIANPSVKQVHFNNGGSDLDAPTLKPNWNSQQPMQYYTFHPKSLHKERGGAVDKPSVLEMENNYLLKHHQRQSDPEFRLSNLGGTLTRGGAGGGYAGFDPTGSMPRSAATVLSGRRLPRSGAGPPRLTRVRSEELLGTRHELDLRPPMETEENCRWFVALFDYDHHMSPNPSAQEEELGFRKHQLIKVHGDLDQDGFYKGQIGRRVGLVPSNMVFELAKDDLLPQEPPPRMQDAGYPLEPSIRRMRWGSLKSRSYDTAAGDHRRAQLQRMQRPSATELRQLPHVGEPYGSLDRRDHSLPTRRPPYDYGDAYDPYGNPPAPGARGEPHGETMRRGLYEPREARQDAYYARQDEYDPRGDYRRRREASYAGRGIDQRSSDRDRYDYPPDQRDVRDQRDPRDHRDQRDHQRSDYPNEPRDRGDMGRPHEGPMGPRREEAGPGLGAGGPGQQPSRHPTRTGAYPGGGRSGHGGASMQEMQQGTPGYGQQPGGMGQPEPAAGRSQPSAPFEDRVPKVNGDVSTRVMLAKFDYDPVQSPNVDAEQVELGFRKEDLITVYGEMDEDGFFWGELRSEPGRMGLVPSNFLQELHEGGMGGMGMPATSYGQPSTYGQERGFTGLPMEPTQPPIMVGAPGAAMAQSFDQPSARPKGVAFTDIADRKITPARQISQTSSNKVNAIMGAAETSSGKAAKVTGNAVQNKVAKKSSDVSGTKGANSTRKPSQAPKKSDATAKGKK